MINENNLMKFSIQDRMKFVRKVYSLLGFQLLITVIFCICSFTIREFRDFQVRITELAMIALVLSIGIQFALFCIPRLARKVPLNYFLLLAYTLCISWLLSYLCSYIYITLGDDGAFSVLIAAVFCCAICFSLTIYALFTKTDYTVKWALVWMISMGLLFFLIFALLFQSRALFIFYSFLAVIAFGFFLIYDTQLIFGGKTHLELSIDDYVIGSMILYGDIIYMFFYILQLVIAFRD